MKVSDDYKAKYRLWARNPKVCALPKAVGLPYFGHKKFTSYEEMNNWKREYLLRIAAAGGVKWTKQSGDSTSTAFAIL